MWVRVRSARCDVAGNTEGSLKFGCVVLSEESVNVDGSSLLETIAEPAAPAP